MDNHNKMVIGFLALIPALLFGCSGYPDEGTGGLAENYLSTDISSRIPDQPVDATNRLKLDWRMTHAHLKRLEKQGANWCYPASVVQSRKRQNRIARELEGGLGLDAANDLVIQRQQLKRLEAKLNASLHHRHCIIPDQTEQLSGLADAALPGQQVNVVSQLYDLLNINDQFIESTVDMNPAYIENLAHASYILKDYPNLQLSVTAYADPAHARKDLASNRAQQVIRYLQIFGLPARQTATNAMGVMFHSFPEDGPRLSNRWVSIEVIPMNDDKGVENAH